MKQKDLVPAHVTAAVEQALAPPQVVIQQEQPGLDHLSVLKKMAVLQPEVADKPAKF
jgi:hypothetical protein